MEPGFESASVLTPTAGLYIDSFKAGTAELTSQQAMQYRTHQSLWAV